MANLGGFNPDDVPPDERGSLEPVPAGIYDLEVIESDLVPTKNGSGQLLKLTHQIVSGPYENRLIWSQHNFLNASAKAQEIGQREISDLCRAIGHTGVLEDSNDLHGIPYRARVTVERDEVYGPKNVIKRFLPRDGVEQAAPAARAAPAQRQGNTPTRQAPPPAAAGNGKPGWMNRAGAAR